MKFDKLGWVVALAVTGALAIAGFQGQSSKYASVDIEKVFNTSELIKEDNSELQTFKNARVDVLKFIQANPGMNPADADRFAVLTMQAKRTAQEDTELGRIKTDAESTTRMRSDMMTKQTPTEDDKKKLNELGANAQKNSVEFQTLETKYDQEIRDQGTKLHGEALEKVRKAIRSVAGSKGFTVVYSAEFVPFAGNDLTKEAIDEVNKR